MPSFWFRLVLFSLLWGIPFFSAEIHAETSSHSSVEILQWVSELGNEDFNIRTTAEERLLKAGVPVLPQLQQAFGSGDAEVRMRAQRLYNKILIASSLKKMNTSAPKTQIITGEMEITRRFMDKEWSMQGHFWAHEDGKRFAIEVNMQQNEQLPLKVVCDGTHIYIERLTASNKRTAKYSIATLDKLGDGNHQNPLRRMQKLPELFDFNKVEEASVEGHACNKLLGAPIKAAIAKTIQDAESIGGTGAASKAKEILGQISHACLYIDKNSLVARRLEILDKDGKVIEGVTLKNIISGERSDEKRFKYTPGKGVTVIDIDERLKEAREK